MKTNLDGAEAIFYEAIELGETSREAFLNEVCGDDRGVREEVDGLVADHARAGDFLEKPAARIPSDDHSPMAERPGMIIGPYKLMGQIGEGGFGLVFVAEQRQPLRRKVALKIIKPGMDTKQVIARFEVERQALAMMDHPNIAKVLDAGATETGRPYFVMELVRGESVTEYCDRNNLSISQRLEIFRRVCGAVQHAHQKGVIHRDIKPSNVLITIHDDKPLPKVIDFGIAKATHAPLTQKTLFTDRRLLIGTPDYTSPEQAGAIAADIDTRSDIYSLGVLLYELLTGTTPFDSQALRAAGYEEMQRIIREVEPPKPSSRLSTMGENLVWVARHRREDPERLGTIVRGDLDCIVVKALEKDRTRRYETAAELADDILNYLQGDPVNATPPSRAYRLRKFARKHRGPVIAGTLIAAVMAIATVSSAAFGTAALHARNLMNKALLAQAAETERARSAEADAMRLAQELEQFAFVVQEVSNTEVVDARRWERTVDLLVSREPMALTPANTARIAVLRGAVQLRLDRPAEAIEHFRNGLAAWHEAWDDHRFADLRTLHTATIGIQALVRSDAVASRDEARELIEHVIRAWRSIDPKYPDDYDRIGIFLAGEALTRLGDDETAEPLLRESAQRLGATPRYQDWLGKAANELASLLDRTGRQAEAQELREREQQRRIEAEQKGKPDAAAIARSAAAKAAKLVAGKSPTEAMEALHRSLEAWHAAWDNHRFADLETLGSVTDAAVVIAVGASKVDAKEVGNVVDLVVKAWETLRHKYPPDFAHLGLIPAGEAMMARGENAEAQRLLEQAEGVLDASSRYKEWHRWCVVLLADVTARRGDDDRAAEWTQKLQLLAPSNKERPLWPWAASAQ